MPAWENLNERQFGPQGKYTTRFTDMYDRPINADHEIAQRNEFGGSGPSQIEAVHTKSGRLIGRMNWHSHSDGEDPTIHKIAVSSSMRRKGMASAMLDHARSVNPGLKHSHALTDDGSAWAKARP